MSELEHPIEFRKEVIAGIDLYCKYFCVLRKCLNGDSCPLMETKKQLGEEINKLRQNMFEMQKKNNGKIKKPKTESNGKKTKESLKYNVVN